MQMSVQVPVPAGARWIFTLAMPPPSEAVASRLSVPLMFAPGSVRETVGATLSIRRFVTVELAELPATSLATARKS